MPLQCIIIRLLWHLSAAASEQPSATWNSYGNNDALASENTRRHLDNTIKLESDSAWAYLQQPLTCCARVQCASGCPAIGTSLTHDAVHRSKMLRGQGQPRAHLHGMLSPHALCLHQAKLCVDDLRADNASLVRSLQTS